MFKNQANKQKSIRFRRWNRAGYAVFVSLSAIVSIGSINTSICDKSLSKSKQGIIVSECNLNNNTPENQDKISDSETNLEQKTNIILNQKTTTEVATLLLCNIINLNG